jgi:hypothetical protein
MSSQLNNLIFRLQTVGPNQEAILRILLPLLSHPGILFVGFALISVIIPLIEETFKPIGVWFLVGQKLTPAQGFAFGILSGAGFGLFENLGNTSGSGEAWVLVASTRISTLLLHCLTAGLVGWALTSAWSQRKYLRLGITFTSAVVLHGLWNGLAVLSSISGLEGLTNIPLPADLEEIGRLSAFGIVALGAFNLALYIGFNTRLRGNLNGKTTLSEAGVSPHPPEISPTTSEEGESTGKTSGIGSFVQSPADDSPSMPPKGTQHISTEEELPSPGEPNS